MKGNIVAFHCSALRIAIDGEKQYPLFFIGFKKENPRSDGKKEHDKL